jgi:type IX secretion system PorP/SprF family membrane protein
MKKYIFTILFVSAIFFAKAQDPNFSQFFASPLTINPALTGSPNSDLRVFTNYRQQWLGNNTSYNTGTLSIDGRLFKEQLEQMNHVLGVGGFFMRDQSLNGYFKSTYASLNASYSLAIDEYGVHNIGIGLAGIYGDRRLDFSQLTFSEQFGSGGFNTALPTGENSLASLKPYLSVASGLIYRYRGEETDIDFGVSGYHYNKPKQSFLSDSLGNSLPTRFVSHFNMENYLSENFSLSTNAIYQTQASQSYLAAGAILNYGTMDQNEGKIFSIGLFYRSDDAIYPYVGLIVDRIQFGLTYDIVVSNLKTSSYTPRTFELSIIYNLANRNLKERKLMRCSRW